MRRRRRTLSVGVERLVQLGKMSDKTRCRLFGSDNPDWAHEINLYDRRHEQRMQTKFEESMLREADLGIDIETLAGLVMYPDGKVRTSHVDHND